MSYTKRYLEDVTCILAESAYYECYDLANIENYAMDDVKEEIFEALCNGGAFDIYSFFFSAMHYDGEWYSPADMPKTFEALETLRPLVETEEE